MRNHIMLITLLVLTSMLSAQWNIQTIDNSGDAGTKNDIAYDAQGYPHVVWKSGSNQILYSYWTGSAWSASQDLGVCEYNLAIDIDPAGDVHIVWNHYSSNNYTLEYRNITSGESKDWDSYFNNSTLYHKSDYVDIAVERIMYYGKYQVNIIFDTGLNNLRHLRYDASQTIWVQGSLDAAANVGDYCQIISDNDGQIHAVYYDTGATSLKYAKYDGTNWNVMYVDEADVGEYCSIAVDASGNPHISYYDAANGNLKYATPQ